MITIKDAMESIIQFVQTETNSKAKQLCLATEISSFINVAYLPADGRFLAQ
ncbi:MAG: hypothetical protein RIA69_06115 [Cyclobacteriaceae bacterium]